MATARTSSKEAFDKLGVRVLALEQTLVDRDAKIAALEAQVKTLEARTGRPVVREIPANVKALPKLEADPTTGRADCAEHGNVSLNTRGLCPKCFTEATKAASMAKFAPAAA